MDHNTLRRFVSQPAIGNMPERDMVIRGRIIDAADSVLDLAGDCRERSLALSHLEEALMWATKAIYLGDAIIVPPAQERALRADDQV